MDLSQVAIRKFTGSFATAPTINGAKKMDLAEDTTSGRQWECTDDNPTNQVWERRGRAVVCSISIGTGADAGTRIAAAVVPATVDLYPANDNAVPEGLQGNVTDLVINHNLGSIPALSMTVYDSITDTWTTSYPQNVTHTNDFNWLMIPNLFVQAGNIELKLIS